MKLQPNQIMKVMPNMFLTKTCFWKAEAPTGYNVVLSCTPIQATARVACTTDRFLVSMNGDPDLHGARTYCGTKEIKLISDENIMTFGAASIVNRNAVLPRNCEVSAVPVAKPCSCGKQCDKDVCGRGFEYATLVAIVHKDHIDDALCGGTIIDVRHVLTTATCLLDGSENLLVKAGIVPSSPWSYNKMLNKIPQSYVHEKFRKTRNNAYDIGLIRLTEDIQFSLTVELACLPFQFENFNFAGANLTHLLDLERKPWQIVSDVFSTVWSGIVNFFTEEEYDLEKICINITLKVQPYKNILLTPYKYLPKTCLWTVLAPIGYNVLLHCAPLKSTPRFACTTDRFLISTSGDPNLTGADTYCGDKTFKALSSGNVMTLGAVTFGFPNAIRPSCRLTARPVPKPCSCGMRYNKTSTEYPMFVAIVHKDNEHKAICGGTIIDNRHVLTSALCIRDGTDNLLVKVGMLSSSPWSFHKTYQILYSVKHENYSDRHFGFKDVPYDDYDIGLIRLSDVIKFSTFAGAACLPIQFQNFDLTGTNLTYLLFHNFTEYIMLDVKVVSVNMCDALNYTAPEKTQFCNQPSLIGENDMTYIGSGGPVLYKDPDNDMLYVVGIISQVSLQYDQTKHSFEPVYDVKVAPLLGWILKFTTEVIVDEYCQV